MSLFGDLISLLFVDFWAWTWSIIVGFVTFKIVKFYTLVYSLPRGPFPLPIIGTAWVTLKNVIQKKPLNFFRLVDLEKKYGKIFTTWLGNTPIIIMCDIDVIREAFNEKRNDFMGRQQDTSMKDITGIFNDYGKGSDIITADFGPAWHSLRLVAHSAVRKYAVSEKLATLVNDVMDEIVPIIMENEKLDDGKLGTRPFDPAQYIYLIIYNILASSAFGKRYSMNDPEFLTVKEMTEKSININSNVTPATILASLFPILRKISYFDKQINSIKQILLDFKDFIRSNFENHLKDFDKNEIRDFTDALIDARIEAEEEDKQTKEYLKNGNLILSLFNLFQAGSDTTHFTFRWMLLLMSNYTSVQNKLRAEINSIIGDRRPVQEDMKSCHYVRAFISECQRFRGITPFGTFHATICDTELCGYKIPKGTTVIPGQWIVSFSSKHWHQPETFEPERFFEADNGNDGKTRYVTTKPIAFIPFGTGRRVCLGEKMALVDLFLILVRFIQLTNGYQVQPEDGPETADLEPDPKMALACFPKSFKIKLEKCN